MLDDLTKAEKFKEASSSKTEKLNLLTQSHNILIEQVRVLLCAQDLETYFLLLLFSLFQTTLADYLLQRFSYRCSFLEKQLNITHQTLTMQVPYSL